MMKKDEIINVLNQELANNYIKFTLDDATVDKLIIDVSRVVDDKITSEINKIKNNLKIRINSYQKELIRKKIIGYPVSIPFEVSNYEKLISNDDYERAYSLVAEGFERNSEIMVKSLIARIKVNFLNLDNKITDRYLEYLDNIQRDKKQLVILSLNSDEQFSCESIEQTIFEKYDELSNYHYMIILFKDGIRPYSWKDISEIGIFMENFKLEKNFNVFKNNRKRRVNDLSEFLRLNNNIVYNDDIENLINSFYEGVSYGFQFEDLFISSDGSTKVLVMQKVELDEEPKLCPVCMEDKVRGNSYPKILYKSFECQNPSCASRSKIGRGKRFDLYGAKRQMMLERNSELDQIAHDIYRAYRRDIVDPEDINIENLISLYTWAGDNIEVINEKIEASIFKGRNVTCSILSDKKGSKSIQPLRIVELLTSISKSIIFPTEFKIIESETIENQQIIHGNSTDIIPNLNILFDGAITSPPYYNAREYSQWSNLLCYLIDMMINAKAIYENLKYKGTYIYNIGDIVGQDNIYIKSNMSKRRQMLGFYSALIFQIVGFEISGNIIWDKGEVQSKRNSTPNHISGYLKPVNAYEHCFIMKKKDDGIFLKTKVEKIDAVKKINSKGMNTYGHTAPYPLGIAELIIPFVKKEGVVLDPFVGSGTTLIAMKASGINGVGFELNKDYYQLAIDRIRVG